jgi:DNA polymerase-1
MLDAVSLDEVPPAAPLALVVAPDGVAIAWPGGSRTMATGDGATGRSATGGGATDTVAVIREVAALDPRWLWWSARTDAPVILDVGVAPRTCWDLGAVARLLHGGSRDDPAAVWAAQHGLPEPPRPQDELDLLAHDDTGTTPVRDDGQLSRTWVSDGPARSLDAALQWARLAVDVHRRQSEMLAALPDPRRAPRPPGLPTLTAHAESAAALLALELSRDGLPVDRDVLGDLLRPIIGPPPVDDAHAESRRRARDDVVRRLFPHSESVDLRNPAQVKEMLVRVGLDLPDTRSWRLEPHAATSPPVAALLSWRRAERLATTYGWSWLDRHVGTDGRLRGEWSAAEGAGRMTASAGLHNLPAELRAGVCAQPGHVFVRADLGQVEPRVLAVVAGDEALAQAAREDDMYAPVAARLGCDRPTAKVAVLAAMYGQTSGTAGNALRQMETAYPRALAYLRAAEEAGRTGQDLRTYGGRLLRMRPGWGRFARNAMVQGAAAELFKSWAATVRVRLPAGAQIVLCLHDELLVHTPGDLVGDTAAVVTDALGSTASWWAAGSGVRFVADVSAGASWAAAH